ncbi:pyridoxamine 5'-phosphate oxidase family protein [Noviherbaspirillum sp. Root189]|uniref:pyridoxamine 5'-phosphate oxidase family protein n=1 Tax=Noviherbaspirillum sp. Root189 TaxID=1736487 RepID=UPI00070D5E8E|nr:pyridoxamine 5'-phosphate oxidase family protein [Noviherbaspirillum sp. Root189]KRB79141.1 pyridoxamine 5'-phosphate oxidase [Noviherbaspirillum sp. Root189]
MTTPSLRQPDSRFDIVDIQALQPLFDSVGEASRAKEIDYIDANYRALIEASPFVALATSGPDGVDCSPRGDAPGFIEVLDERTLVLPERRGNNRIDSLRNLITNPHVALLFLIPGIGHTLRVNGRARINADPVLLARHAVDGKVPKLALVIDVDTVFFQCSRAIVRADLWNPDRHVKPDAVPSPGRILEAVTAARIDGQAYDRELPGRIGTSLY